MCESVSDAPNRLRAGEFVRNIQEIFIGFNVKISEFDECMALSLRSKTQLYYLLHMLNMKKLYNCMAKHEQVIKLHGLNMNKLYNCMAKREQVIQRHGKT